MCGRVSFKPAVRIWQSILKIVHDLGSARDPVLPLAMLTHQLGLPVSDEPRTDFLIQICHMRAMLAVLAMLDVEVQYHDDVWVRTWSSPAMLL